MRIPTWGLFAAMGGIFGLLALAGSSTGAEKGKRAEKGERAPLPPKPLQLVPDELYTYVINYQPQTLEGLAHEGLAQPQTLEGLANVFQTSALIPEKQASAAGQYIIGPGYATPPKDVREWARNLAFAEYDERAERDGLKGNQLLFAGDEYTEVLYLLPTWLTRMPVTEPDPQNKVIGNLGMLLPTDQYGRVLPGEYGSGGATFGPEGLLDAIGAIYENPLGRFVVNAAIIYASGGTGAVAIAAYSAYENRGRSLSLQEYALQAGRAYAVSQCGEVCGIAFDFGVGVASGKEVDEAAEDALYQSMTPEEQAYYDEGKRAYRELA